METEKASGGKVIGSVVFACGVTGLIVAWRLISAIMSPDTLAIHDFIASVPKYLMLGVVIFAFSMIRKRSK